jgi:hypothetical protein
MDDNTNKFFYISAIVAFSSYFVLVALLIVYISTNDVKKFDLFSKDTILELDIVVQKIKKTQKDKQPKKIQVRKKTHKISKKIVKKSTSVSAKQKSNLKSLFANVKTKASSVKKKVVNNVQKSLTTSRFKAKFEKQTKSNNLLSKLLDDKKVNITKQKIGDTKNEHDPYISKIYEILYQRWQPLLIVDGLSTKVIITIYKDGRFNYRILQYSGDSSFDDQLVLFLEKQKEEKFPIPKKSRIDIEVIFTAKG